MLTAVFTFGIDSLVALEVRYYFGEEIRADVRVWIVMRNQNLRDLGRFCCSEE